MSETTQNKGLLNLPPKGTEVLCTDNHDWIPDGNGFWYKSLLEDNNHKLRSILMKVDAGAFTESHTHEDIEQIYVISGSFYDDQNSYKAGDYIVRAAGAPHTAGSKDGCVVMLFYSPA